jgi:serine/threonine-protein kinase HipA
MRKQGKVFYKDREAGIVWQDENGYGFRYDAAYLDGESPFPVSLTLPLREEPYTSNTMIPFFDGLIPEGWLLELTIKNWKVQRDDRMEILLIACKDCIGAVSVERIENIDGNEA